VAKGESVVAPLLERLDTSDYAESVYIVFCLRELKAKGAKKKISDLGKLLAANKRYQDLPHDLTLSMQIKFYLDDVDTYLFSASSSN
jgi:hypothetical protein